MHFKREYYKCFGGKMLDKIKDVWFYLINHGFNKEYLLNFIVLIFFVK